MLVDRQGGLFRPGEGDAFFFESLPIVLLRRGEGGFKIKALPLKGSHDRVVQSAQRPGPDRRGIRWKIGIEKKFEGAKDVPFELRRGITLWNRIKGLRSFMESMIESQQIPDFFSAEGLIKQVGPK